MPVAPRFHALTIAEICREAPDAVAIRLAVPGNLADRYRFDAGQYLTLRKDFGGQELRRCYSICSAPNGGGLWIGVREDRGGRFSGWLNRKARPGDCLDVMTPDGRFTLLSGHEPRNVLLVAAGSGITPVLSVLATLLSQEPESTATLLYANRDSRHIMFRETLADLKDRYVHRLRLFHILSREPSAMTLATGRIDPDKCERFFAEKGIAPAARFDAAYLCGPEELMDMVAARLEGYGLPTGRMKRELFLNAKAPPRAHARAEPLAPTPDGAEVTVILDQRRRTFVFDPREPSILDAARSAGMDVPYACKAGVCATCRAQLVEGEVTMARNQALDQDELDRGFVLTCQSRPTSGKIVVDYDRRSG